MVEPIGATGDDGHQQKRQHDGRRAALARQLAAVLLGQTRDVHDDDGDVVVAAPAHGLVHQLSRATLGLAVAGEDLGNLVIFQHRGKPVGAQKQTVAGFHGQLEQVRLGARVAAQGAGDDRALGMNAGLGLSNLPGLNKVGHKRVVAGELLHLPLMQKVGARVAHLGDDELVLLQHSGGAGAAHAGAADALAGGADDGEVRLFHGLSQSRGIGVRRRAVADDVHGDFGCYFPRGVAAHAVAHHVQRRGNGQRVLVVLAYAADVGATAESSAALLALCPGHYWFLTRMSTSPMVTRSLLRRATGSWTGRPFTAVPFFEPRSSTKRFWPISWKRAWRPDT